MDGSVGLMEYDVVVVGAGNAAHAAAVSARNAGAERVLMIEKAPQALRGGNTHYSGGLFRFAFNDASELQPLVPDVQVKVPGFLDNVPPYPAAAFEADLRRVTEGRTDPQLAEILVSHSYDTVRWVHDQGIRMEAAVSLSAVEFEGDLTWPSGAVIRAAAEGVGLSRMWFKAAAERNIELRCGTGIQRLVQDQRGCVTGLVVRDAEGEREIVAHAVVLACGGFEANAEWRARYLGSPWDTAKVRGTRYNNGDGLRLALEIGALPHGQWSGMHGTPIDAEAPPFGDRKLTDKTNRLSYPWGVTLNTAGNRFIDEGEDFALYTYAKTGGAILSQPGGVAFQIFDAGVSDLLEPRYDTGTPIVADTLEELADQLPIDSARALKTLHEFNAATPTSGRFNPTILDGLASVGLAPEKANWARALKTPPYRAYPITGGITFTFGGVRIDEKAQVLSTDWRPIEGLLACGEMVGGLFHHNYPGGAGLMSGAVFGRIAGRTAASL